jgi:hypothetical protein
MVLAMTEVAALEVLEKIKKFEASMTWPHPSGEGYTSAIFLTLESDKPYLLYVPQSKVAAVYTKDELNDWFNSDLLIAEQFKIEYYLYENLSKVRFYLIPLDQFDNKKVKKKDIEKMFGIKVVE